MAPFVPTLAARAAGFNPGDASSGFSTQYTNPNDVFSVLLILGGDVVARALAQLTGRTIGPPSFSFGKLYLKRHVITRC
jgi:alpha-glucosidase (family GH31 glycosyl hydrolase)